MMQLDAIHSATHSAAVQLLLCQRWAPQGHDWAELIIQPPGLHDVAGAITHRVFSFH